METTYRTYKFYDTTGRRLSIFGFQNEGGCEIYVIPCDRRDTFSKKVAKDILASYMYEGVPFKVQQYHVGEITKQREFMAWCEEEFYKLFTDKLEIKGILHSTKVHRSDKMSSNRYTLGVYILGKV